MTLDHKYSVYVHLKTEQFKLLYVCL